MSRLSFDDFQRGYEAGTPVLVSTTLIADLETPVSAFLKLTGKRSGNVFLLESVEGGAARGRYSMIGMDPDIIWRAQGDSCEINRNALGDPDKSPFTPTHCTVLPLLLNQAPAGPAAKPPCTTQTFVATQP